MEMDSELESHFPFSCLAHDQGGGEDEEAMQRIHSMQTQISELEAQLEVAQQEASDTKQQSDKALAEMRRQMERAMYVKECTSMQ